MVESRARILIVDDEPIKRTVLEDELRDAGYDVKTAANPLEAEEYLDEAGFDVVLTDLRMPGQDGLSFLRDLKRKRPDQSAVVMTAYGTVETAIDAMKLGAFDYLQKPFSTEELLLVLDKLLRAGSAPSGNAPWPQQGATGQAARIVGRSKAVRRLLADIHSVAANDATVLLRGESGTGKDLAARAIHDTSHRASGPFVPVSCGALPRELVETELFGHEAGAFTGATKLRIGRLEQAHNGTLFLDDVDDIPLEVQVKLLRALQERAFERVGAEETIRVNIRVIAATKKDLAVMVAEGTFRDDLFYRLNVVPLDVPPLRERKEDIGLLAEYFLERSAANLNRGNLAISQAAVARLRSYHWPGNVREFQHLIERMVVMSTKTEFDADDVPDFSDLHRNTTELVSLSLEGVDAIDMSSVLAETEARLLRWAMARSAGNLAGAGEMLGIPRSTLQYKLSKLDPTISSPAPEDQ